MANAQPELKAVMDAVCLCWEEERRGEEEECLLPLLHHVVMFLQSYLLSMPLVH